MSAIKKLFWLLVLVLICAAIPSHAATIYFAPTAQGSNNGTNCANAYAWTDATNGIHTTGATASWSAGNTLSLCPNNTFTCPSAGGSGIVVAGNGSSGNPITVLFGANVVLSCTYWGNDPINVATAAGIFCSGHSYITINGGTNGTIQNTANGSPGLGYANAQGSGGVLFNGCPNSTIENLIVQNIYVHQAGSSDTAGSGTTGCISAGYNGSASASGTLIQNNTVNNCFQGIGLGYESTGSGQNITSAQIANNSINVSCHFISIGDGNSGSTAANITVNGNTIGTDFNTWIDSTSACHQDGMIISAFNSGSAMTGLNIYGNQVSAGACTASGGNFTGYIFLTGTFTTTNIFNNILNAAVTTNGCQLQGLIRLDPGTPAGSMTTTRVLNNTVDFNSVSNSSGATNNFLAMNGNNTSGNFTGNDFRNNVVINFANGGGVWALTNDTGSEFSQSTAHLDYNVYNSNISKFGHDDVNGQDYITFTNWRTSSATNSFPGYDPNGSQAGGTSLSLNSNYTPQSGSPVIGACANLTSLGITALDSDKAGSARPSSGNWDCGAYQFQTSPPSTYNPGVTISQLAPPTNLTATLLNTEIVPELEKRLYWTRVYRQDRQW